MYKTAEGKGENKYGLGGEPVGAAEAVAVARGTHALWGSPGARAGCAFKGKRCWGMWPWEAGAGEHDEL